MMNSPSPSFAFTRRKMALMLGGAALAASIPFTGGAQAAQPGERRPLSGMLFPHESVTRSTRDLSGFWRFKTDPSDVGEREGWEGGLPDHRLIPVPASWNDIFDDVRNYTGTAWYETDLHIAKALRGQRIHLRFGSVQYEAKVWLNGRRVGGHTGGHLPFVIDITDAVSFDGANRLTVQVENKIRLDRIPATPDRTRFQMTQEHFPQTTYDFFPYTGIHRPVLLMTTPPVSVQDVTVVTELSGRTGRVSLVIETSTTWSGQATVELAGQSVRVDLREGQGRALITIPNVSPWSPADPHLYPLTIRLSDTALLDEYSMKIGVRTIRVQGEELLLNGEPVFLRGFGKHEDFPLHGRGLDIVSIARDFELLKWIGANSLRTSHYPYSEEAMMLADEVGLLVIDETSAVSLVFGDLPEIIEARRVRLEQEIVELVQRDKNRPCVIAWSVANEPLTQPFQTVSVDGAAAVAAGTIFFQSVFAKTRALDNTRPVVLVSVQSGPAEWIALSDIACTNAYTGWYWLVGQLETARTKLAEDVRAFRDRHAGKPLFFTEFGADAIAGIHSQPAEMFSEEYQSEMIQMFIEVLAEVPQVIGTHPWAFADFRTSQSTTRIGALNHKGVFTRDRRPKLAANTLRRLWTGAS